MNVTLYKFAKKQNSTARPGSGTASLSLTNVNLNDGASSILNPILRISKSAAWGQATDTDIIKYNYAYISEFNRYYYINDWQYNGDGTWSAELDVDVLGTWQLEIKASGGYVGRAASSSLADYWIADSLYPATTEFAVKTATGSTGFNPALTSGTFVIGVISGQEPNVGAVSYYVTTASEMTKLVQNIVGQYGTVADPEAFGDITNLDSSVLKSLVNPVQYIVSCKWFPFGASITGLTASRIYLWGWYTGAVGFKLNSAKITQYFPGTGVSIDDKVWGYIILPELAAADVPAYSLEAYPPYAPYAEYNLITAWGTFDLDPNIISNLYFVHHALLYYRFVVNLISGTGSMIVGVQPYKPTGTGTYNAQPFTELFRREVELGLDIPLAQVSYNYVDIGHNAINLAQNSANAVAGAMATGGFSLITGGLSSVAHSVIDAAASMLSPTVQSTGSAGAAFTELITEMKYQMIRYRTITKHANTMGTPVKKHIASINAANATGFIKFDMSEFTGGATGSGTVFCTETERIKVKEYLESGVFIET